jgi:hypothetical protein
VPDGFGVDVREADFDILGPDLPASWGLSRDQS